MEVATKGKAKRRHLNVAECNELGRSAEGTGALTRPNTVNQTQGNCNPNRGLYPRTPTKRWKCASNSGSPSGQQKSINSFFSVTGVISSSPHKSPQPCSSTCTNGVNAELFPKIEDDDDDDEDEDVSLLAAPMAAEPELEEFEVDDESLLAADMGLQPDTRQNVTVDYLEGMTAEMFGDDEDFDANIHFNEDEEEVEALPDKHFGLLGNNKVLQEPQGCMEDLPEEVLRQVLSLVSAQDLYRNAIHVCHRWKNIIEDSKFVPFKKQYFRYMMMEKETVMEIVSVLKKSNITKPAPPEHSIRNLVVLMAQHKVGERVRPEDVLEYVKKHRLFPQAEASIRLHIPDIKKSFNLGIEGPNPYAAMAIILLLSESVGDVQTLVSLLTGCMTYTAITEYLNHMATMLLALRRSGIQVSNRLHYNIYYVLHLMENGPFSVSSGQSGRPQMQLTGEQQHILSHNIQADHVVKIVAFAGTGKTTTLVKYAEQRPHLRFLYVAFNKSVATEAQRRFPRNVDCKTVHSLAFKDVGRIYHSCQKLTFNLKPFALNSALPEGRGGYKKAKVVALTLNAFMASADETIDSSHVPHTFVSRKGSTNEINPLEIPCFVEDAKMIWNKMKDQKEKRNEAFYMTHDGYLKLWQLKNPKPRLSDQYDVIFIDEAQDCTPAIMDVLLSQRCGKILVGDPHQQIYTFKGAVNALQIIEHTHIYYLTQSFRFGAEIAYVGATILKVCKSVHKILVGGKQKGGVCDETAEKAAAAVRQGISHCPGQTAILSRCNLTVFNEAVRLTDANSQCRLHFVGGIQSIGLSRILDIWHLSEGARDDSQRPGQQPKFIRDPLIRAFAKKNKNGFLALKWYAMQTEDKELDAKLSIVERHRNRIPELVKRLEECHEDDFNIADFILGTVHKAKGLEFDTVMITDDFTKVPSSRHNLHHYNNFSFDDVENDEWNLLYVAVTRARTSLIITKNIRRILTLAGEYFLKSDMPDSLIKEGQALPCCVQNCPNCTTPGAAFIMSKQEMKCTDGVSAGGPLCERCVWTRIGPIAYLMTDDVHSMAEIPQMFVRPRDHLLMLLALF
ncbi:F-box DNA helicase 1 [Cheilinus undulatus]|uniref:F-box DNA helicase 1 n=1 Tax=Cheilinus undulatus TaxID=241271 RepID=UPI001BD2A6F8|nr:F-box DNA helicase 1 [Cheilinus undulatus]